MVGGAKGPRLPCGATLQPMRDIVSVSDDGETCRLSCGHEEPVSRTPSKRKRCSQCKRIETYSDPDIIPG
jgi:hypothetical protein